jgi:SAM-dependent methyltransferase
MEAQDQRRLYADLSWTWPIISPPEEYAGEAEEFHAPIAQRAPDARTLLHLGCGRGHLDSHLKRHYAITSIDRSPAMLALARGLNPEAEYVEGDLRTARLGRTFDAVMAADAMDYMLTEDDLRAAFRTAFEHLRPGGVFVTYAEFTPERFRQDRTKVTTHARGDVAITFVEHAHDRDPHDTTFEITFVYLIRRGGDLRIETDRHLQGLIPLDAWRRLLRETGFLATEIAGNPPGPGEPPTPMFAAVRPPAGAERNL